MGTIDNGPRRSGRSTRQADAYIQIFFEEGMCLVRDHASFHKDSTERLVQIIRMRLKIEHNITNDLKIIMTRNPQDLRGLGIDENLVDWHSREIYYGFIQYIKPKLRDNPVIDYGVPQVEELPDEEFHIPGMIHRKGVDPDTLVPPAESKGFQLGDAKQVPFLQKSTGSRFDKFNSK